MACIGGFSDPFFWVEGGGWEGFIFQLPFLHSINSVQKNSLSIIFVLCAIFFYILIEVLSQVGGPPIQAGSFGPQSS
jgi:uncharacterized membrane protein (UPF0182 family)